jgi:hypothetical protein
MMTENKARTKWCPFVRTHMGGAAVNRMLTIEPSARTTSGAATLAAPDRRDLVALSTRCIASECMMWRWKAINANQGFCGLNGEVKWSET